MANLAWVTAEVELAGGAPAAAVDVLLDSVQFGGDLVQVPSIIGEMVGSAVLGATLRNALVDHGLLWRLPAAEVARLAAALRQLDARIATRGLAREAELAGFARSIEHGPSGTLGSAALFESTLMVQRELEGIEGAEWAAAKQRLERVDSQAMELAATPFGNQESVEIAHRIGRASLRLLIAAAELRAGVDGELLTDPFGSVFLVSETAEGVQIQSVGPEGRFDAERYPTLLVLVPSD